MNVRDLGGLRSGARVLRRGVIVRASCMGTPSPAGLAAMRQHGVRSVVDIREADEAEESPSPFREGVRYFNVPFHSGRVMALHDAALAGTMPAQLRALGAPESGLAAVVSTLAMAEACTLLHCLAGRDRTGIVIALTLAAIGVDEDDIVADYKASDDDLADSYRTFVAEHPERAAAVADGIARREWVMRMALETLRADFGGGAAFLNDARVSAASLDLLRAKLLT